MQSLCKPLDWEYSAEQRNLCSPIDILEQICLEKVYRNFSNVEILSQYTISWTRTILNDLVIYHSLFVEPKDYMYLDVDARKFIQAEVKYALEMYFDCSVKFYFYVNVYF